MITQIIFLNLFFVPVISVYLLYKLSENIPHFCASLLMEYCIAVVVNTITMKAIILIYSKLTDHVIGLDSTYYTLIAAIVAVIIPYLYEVIKKSFNINIEIYKEEK